MSNQLYLPDWTVFDAPIDADGAYQISAAYDVVPTECGACGVVDAPLYKHGSKVIRYVDAPVHGRQTFIHVKRVRYRCRECGGTFMQPLPDMDDDRRMTHRCRDYIEKQCLLKPNTHVAEDVGINEKVIRQIGKANADKLFAVHAEGITAPRIMGMDELFLGDEMRAIFVNIETSWPFEILPNRWAKPVTNFLMNLPGRHQVEVVTMDMWKPYKVAVQYAMPQAVVIIDKWHVMRMANDAMDIARRRYQGLLTQRDRKALKARRAAFLRRPFQLSAREQLDLDGWLKNTPELRGAYEAKEAFMDIWRHRKREHAKEALDAWRSSIPDHLTGLFRPIMTATRNWEPEILNYFDHGRWTNAPTEARNRVIKMVNRLGAGYSFDAIRARALFGKRPGRVKAEKAAAEAARLAALKTCASCKALFEPAILEVAHVIPIVAGGDPLNRINLCPDCHRFHTEEWFSHGSGSTRKSE